MLLISSAIPHHNRAWWVIGVGHRAFFQGQTPQKWMIKEAHGQPKAWCIAPHWSIIDIKSKTWTHVFKKSTFVLQHVSCIHSVMDKYTWYHFGQLAATFRIDI